MSTRIGRGRLSVVSVTLVGGFLTLPLVVALGQDRSRPQAASKGQHSANAPTAILHGRVTNDGGTPLADVRVRVAIPAADMRSVDSSTGHSLQETQSDAKGEYRLELSGIAKPTEISIDAMKPGYRRLVGTFMSGGDERTVTVAPDPLKPGQKVGAKLLRDKKALDVTVTLDSWD